MAAGIGNDVQLPTDEAINDSNEMVELLVSLGSDLNTAKTMMCLYVHGPSKSSDLQSRCDLRQPDVSISINKLKKFNSFSLDAKNRDYQQFVDDIYEQGTGIIEGADVQTEIPYATARVAEYPPCLLYTSPSPRDS